MNPLVTSQLTDLYEQSTLQVKTGPPKGWKKFTPNYREAMIVASLDLPAQAVPMVVCPNCDSPRFYMDMFGYIWLKEQGLAESDYVCRCIVCGAYLWGIRPHAQKQAYYKPVKFVRHPDDVVEQPDEFIDPPEEESDVPSSKERGDLRSVSSLLPAGPSHPRRRKTRRVRRVHVAP